jgi:hypothetical protein
MLTRALLVLAVILGLSARAAAEETKVLALGLADHEVTEDELAKGDTPPVPRFNSPGIAYVLMANLKKGDVVEISLRNQAKPLMANSETLGEDKARFLLQVGKTGVPAGGWPTEWRYAATVKITREGKTLLEQETEPIPFE